MPDMGERAYAYAKACGIIGKSFTGKRISALEKLGRLSELDRMVFPSSYRDLPEKELLAGLEKRIIDRSVKSILSVVDCFSETPLFFALLVRAYELADLERALVASLEGEKTAPVYTDIGRFQTVRFGKWPDIKAMIEGTEFSFLLEKNSVLNRENADISLQTELDRRYYNALWEALFSLPHKDRMAAEKILADEISLRNSTWALRLRTYYRMPDDELKDHLIDIPAGGKKHAKAGKRSLAGEALKSLEFPLDNFGAWSSWRWREFLNPQSGIRNWHADPRYFQNAASGYLYRLARHNFRLRPMSLDSIFCFIKLKQYEEDVLTSGAEGLGMGMSGRDIVSLLGAVS